MSSTEPPSRIPPRQQAHETKSAREELSSKGKVEKVREIDADEQTKKKRFMKYYRGVEEEENTEGPAQPSPFDLYSGKPSATAEPSLGEPPPQSNFEDIDSALIPGPSYTPPPNVDTTWTSAEEDQAIENALPQSEDFWTDMNVPGQPQQPPILEETSSSALKKGSPDSLSRHREKVQEISNKEKDIGFLKGKAAEKQETHEKLEKKKTAGSIFGPPEKIEGKGGLAAKERLQKERSSDRMAAPREKQKETGRAPPSKTQEQPQAVPFPSPMEELSKPRPPRGKEIKGAHPASKSKEKEDPTIPLAGEVNAAPMQSGEREERGGDRGRGRDGKILQIESPSLPSMPASIQPMAMAAATQAASYLTPQTVSLFFQMVGTIFVMQGPQAVNRTEIVLNNPAYANSRFYGSMITIEKYATAPDSFNIRLTGSQAAVVSFQENIPSLLTAFQNGGFNFRIGRIDVEYSLERPVFRRKEKGEGRGETGDNDFGERRDK